MVSVVVQVSKEIWSLSAKAISKSLLWWYSHHPICRELVGKPKSFRRAGVIGLFDRKSRVTSITRLPSFALRSSGRSLSADKNRFLLEVVPYCYNYTCLNCNGRFTLYFIAQNDLWHDMWVWISISRNSST